MFCLEVPQPPSFWFTVMKLLMSSSQHRCVKRQRLCVTWSWKTSLSVLLLLHVGCLSAFLKLAINASASSLSQGIGRHLVGVWIGGVWDGHFPGSEKYFSEAEISKKMPEILQKERFSPNFRLRNLKIQNPKTCNSIPPAIYTPTRLPPKWACQSTRLCATEHASESDRQLRGDCQK